MADATIYGQANVSFDMVSSGSSTTTTSYSNNQINSNQSRIGFKGTEDLGGGTSAVWQIESGVNLDSNAGTGLTTRDSFVGLSNEGMGTVILGSHDTPYKIATRGFDLFADTIADNRSLMGGVGALAPVGAGAALAAITAAGLTGAVAAGATSVVSFDQRHGNVLAYISPAMSGFTAAVGYVTLNENSTNLNNDKKSAWSLAGLYGAGPLSANVAYEVHDAGQVNGVAGIKESAWKLGVGYTMDQFTANFVYEKTSDNVGKALALANEDIFGHSSYYLAGKFNVSASDAVKLAYTHAGRLNLSGNAVTAPLANDTSASQVSIGYDHSLSKRTTVYALYTKISNNGDNATSGLAANYGLSNGVSSNGTTASGAGADPSAFSIGMKHMF